MCFAIDIIKRFGWNAFSLTENWEYWAMLTLHDIRVDSAPDAVIYSQVADKLSAGESQRMRWMRGRMQTSQKYAGPLWRAGLRSWDLMKLDAVVEVERPSHAMLLFWSVLYAVVAAGAFSIWPTIDLPFWLALAVVAAQGIYFFTGFLLDRPPLKTWLALAMVPGYLVWKLLVSVRGAFGAGSRAWIRTKRNEP
jgi:cellulose synthase/poly-beta-1,6-N-acetylglucosamine synthase-like glycosyltransferase